MVAEVEKKRVFLGYFYAVCATAIWSGNFIIARGLSDSIPPVSLAFWRWVVAVIAFLPFALKTLFAERTIIRDHIPYLCLTSVLGITLFNTLIYYAGHTTTAINLSLISITFPAFILVLSRIFFSEMITLNKWIGIVLVVIGVILLITKGVVAKLLNVSFAIGDLWMLLAAVTFAIYSILLKHKPRQLSIWSLQLTTFIIGLVFLFPFFIWEYVSVPSVVFELKTILAILYVGIFASLTAFVLWNKAIVNVGPSKAGMIYYTLPLFAGMLSFFFLGESITYVHLLSALLILSGIITTNYEPKSQ